MFFLLLYVQMGSKNFFYNNYHRSEALPAIGKAQKKTFCFKVVTLIFSQIKIKKGVLSKKIQFP